MKTFLIIFCRVSNLGVRFCHSRTAAVVSEPSLRPSRNHADARFEGNSPSGCGKCAVSQTAGRAQTPAFGRVAASQTRSKPVANLPRRFPKTAQNRPGIANSTSGRCHCRRCDRCRHHCPGSLPHAPQVAGPAAGSFAPVAVPRAVKEVQLPHRSHRWLALPALMAQIRAQERHWRRTPAGRVLSA